MRFLLNGFTLNKAVTVIAACGGVFLTTQSFARGLHAYRNQMGSEWGVRRLDYEDHQSLSSLQQAAVRGTVRWQFSNVSSCGAMYLGHFEGLHLVATNQHCAKIAAKVVQIQDAKEPAFSIFSSWDKHSFDIDRCLYSSDALDFTIWSIKVPEEEEHLLKGRELKFDFDSSMRPNQLLFTTGYFSDKILNEDSDCKVVSQENEFRELFPYNDTSRTGVKVFLHACDSYTGLSGSPIFDRASGRVVGIVYGSGMRERVKNASIAEHLGSSAGIQQLIDHPGQVWEPWAFNAGVPMRLIKADIQKDIQRLRMRGDLHQNVARALSDFITSNQLTSEADKEPN